MHRPWFGYRSNDFSGRCSVDMQSVGNCLELMRAICTEYNPTELVSKHLLGVMRLSQ